MFDGEASFWRRFRHRSSSAIERSSPLEMAVCRLPATESTLGWSVGEVRNDREFRSGIFQLPMIQIIDDQRITKSIAQSEPPDQCVILPIPLRERSVAASAGSSGTDRAPGLQTQIAGRPRVPPRPGRLSPHNDTASVRGGCAQHGQTGVASNAVIIGGLRRGTCGS